MQQMVRTENRLAKPPAVSIGHAWCGLPLSNVLAAMYFMSLEDFTAQLFLQPQQQSTGFRACEVTPHPLPIQALLWGLDNVSGCMAYRWLLSLWSRTGRMAEHHRNVPLCSLLDSDGNAETSVDTGVDPTETAAYAGEPAERRKQPSPPSVLNGGRPSLVCISSHTVCLCVTDASMRC